MENEFVKRRIDIIAAHFAPNDEISPTHLLPMNCSGSLNSVLRRCDNKVYFARQASSSFGYFMRQASLEEGDSTSFVAPKSNVAKCEGSNYARAPCFAKPAKKESMLSNSVLQPMTRMQGYDFESLEPPTFSRPSNKIRQGEQLNNEKIIHHSEIEAEGKYVIMVEVPGVNVGDIRVEVDDQKLAIKGRRSIKGCPNDSFSSYHKKEILYGPYEVVWPLPAGVNKESISAEFLDGFLQIIIPKV
ncbi:hypothetical protein TSUD_253480 [Trifolium subterraneum]|nr:hypothetical protein TSUD_253480 [Trifolium subterraneum]